MIQVGTEEVLYDDSVRTVERVRETGGYVRFEVFPDMVHVFQAFWQWLPEAKSALKQTADFIQQHTKKIGRFQQV